MKASSRPTNSDDRMSFKEFAAVLVISGVLGIAFVYAVAVVVAFALGGHPPPG